jgi:hypothetical protein
MGRREIRVWGSRVRLTDFNTGRLSRFNYKLICHFKLAADMIRGGVREFVYENGADMIWCGWFQ